MKNAFDCKELFHFSLIIAEGIFNSSWDESFFSYFFNEDYTMRRGIER